VTGGYTGLGKISAETLIEAGAHVAVCSRRPEKWQNSFRELETFANQHDKRLVGFKCDVTDQNQVAHMVSEVVSKLGSIDILVNNAGTAWVASAAKMETEDWKKVVDINLTGSFLVTREVGGFMIEKRSGKIINMTSVTALRGTSPELLDALSYSASKAGIIGFTRDLAVKWARYRINVNAIAAGWFRTHMTEVLLASREQLVISKTPLGRLGQPADLKGLIFFLSSPASDYVTGQVIALDGGMSITL
jgi:gluconate 5-dehydrogenase